MKMNFYDVLLVIVVANLERRIASLEDKIALVQLGIDILPNLGEFINNKQKNSYEKVFTDAMVALNLLHEGEDASVVRLNFTYESDELMDLVKFDNNYYNKCKNVCCYPDSVKLCTTDLSVLQEYCADIEYSGTLSEE